MVSLHGMSRAAALACTVFAGLSIKPAPAADADEPGEQAR